NPGGRLGVGIDAHFLTRTCSYWRLRHCYTTNPPFVTGSGEGGRICQRNASAVAWSAGRNASMLSSVAVRSSAVPNVVTVLKNVSSRPALVLSRNGTPTPPRSLVSSKPPGYDSI